MATNLPPPLTPALNFTIYEVAGYGELIGKPLTKQQILYQLTHYDETARPALVASAVVMLVISSFGVALRLFARRIKKVNLAADDWMAVTALLLLLGYVTSFFYAIHAGLGVHSIRAGQNFIDKFGKAFYVFQALYGPVCLAIKLSVLLLYRRIFTTVPRAFKLCLWSLFGLFIAWGLGVFFKDVFETVPVNAVWTVKPGAKWIDPIAAFFITGIINAILTLAAIILPMPLIWQMHMQIGKKLGLCAIFTVACGDLVVIIIRCVLVKIEPYPNTDITWSLRSTAILSVVEQALGLLCACLPMTRSLFIDLFSSQRRSRNKQIPPGEARSPSDSSDRQVLKQGKSQDSEQYYLSELEKAETPTTYAGHQQ